MAMTLPLLERIFQDIEGTYRITEVKEKGILFFKNATKIKADLQGDYWIQLSREWDIHFWQGDAVGHYYMSIYRMLYKEGHGLVTDTSAPVSVILLDTWELL
jgi:hypothetical protein